jgi:spore coat protein U-like protein
MKPITLRHLAAAALLYGCLCSPAQAGSCVFTLSGSTLVDFGTYFSLGGDRDQQGNVQLTCTPTGLEVIVSYTLQVGPGLSGNALDRRMYHGSSSLRYNLFKDAARTQVLGDGSSGTGVVTANCVALCAAVPVYGRLYGAQGGPAGAYADAVNVTVNF